MGFTIAELKSQLKARGVKGYSGLKKAELEAMMAKLAPAKPPRPSKHNPNRMRTKDEEREVEKLQEQIDLDERKKHALPDWQEWMGASYHERNHLERVKKLKELNKFKKYQYIDPKRHTQEFLKSEAKREWESDTKVSLTTALKNYKDEMSVSPGAHFVLEGYKADHPSFKLTGEDAAYYDAYYKGKGGYMEDYKELNADFIKEFRKLGKTTYKGMMKTKQEWGKEFRAAVKRTVMTVEDDVPAIAPLSASGSARRVKKQVGNLITKKFEDTTKGGNGLTKGEISKLKMAKALVNAPHISKKEKEEFKKIIKDLEEKMRKK
tara:strand:- start:158 stop:1120 length:963 start_codon:yes stop_codon:yes gene_type:complete